MEEAAQAVDAQQAKTAALLRLRKARAARDTVKTALQQKQSESKITNRYGVGYDAAFDAQISGLKDQLAKVESDLSAAQSACNTVSCETVTVSGDVVTTQLPDGNVSYNDDSLPFWVYILIALFVIGLFVGIVWFVIRDRSKSDNLPILNPPFSEPSVSVVPLAPNIEQSSAPVVAPLVATPLAATVTAKLVTPPLMASPVVAAPLDVTSVVAAPLVAPPDAAPDAAPLVASLSAPETPIQSAKEVDPASIPNKNVDSVLALQNANPTQVVAETKDANAQPLTLPIEETQKEESPSIVAPVPESKNQSNTFLPPPIPATLVPTKTPTKAPNIVLPEKTPIPE